MNEILQLKGKFKQKSRGGGGGSSKMKGNTKVCSQNLLDISKSLSALSKYWHNEKYINGALVSVYYKTVVAKSNRVSTLLGLSNERKIDAVVGAKFSSEDASHIITYFMTLEELENAYQNVVVARQILDEYFGGCLKADFFNQQPKKELGGKSDFDVIVETIDFKRYKFNKTKFKNVIADASHVSRLGIEESDYRSNKYSIITLYETNTQVEDVLRNVGINVFKNRTVGNNTVLLSESEIELLMSEAPYLVSMAVEDLTTMLDDERYGIEKKSVSIPLPKNEPTIGVIDTLFDDSVYFSDWVESYNHIDENITIKYSDYEHGTAVSSIIVDGPTLNPNLDDGCGRFKVRHFGVATQGSFSSFSIIKEIKKIVTMNPDIKVWNLSLGSNDEVNSNFISAEGAILDDIQFENEIIFIVAGTNKIPSEENKRIGAPADSINSLVVNSVKSSKESASYTRDGVVLSFFTKPDVSYYGGDKGEYITVCHPLGASLVSGTSYAAPWIARKMSYLIEVLGLTREVAKALIIDSAIPWDITINSENRNKIGYGVVPIDINEIIHSKNDEIKFVVSSVSEKYDTYSYNFPVPTVNNEFPFDARATLCYFPLCSRSQGVDYTNTELDMYFGRITDRDKIDSINKNKQSVPEIAYLYEKNARSLFRKWDNVKHIQDKPNPKRKGKPKGRSDMWGLSVKTKERLRPRDGYKIRFGVVVTLKEVNGINRIEEFIQMCSFRGWIVNSINVENQIDIYQAASEDLNLK